eukprot:2388704-Rhodomonas_salina.1
MRRLLKRVLLMRRGEQAGQPDFPLYMYLDSVRLLADKKVFVPVTFLTPPQKKILLFRGSSASLRPSKRVRVVNPS